MKNGDAIPVLFANSRESGDHTPFPYMPYLRDFVGVFNREFLIYLFCPLLTEKVIRTHLLAT